MPEDVKWHFIGHLQSNKVNALVKGVPNLSLLETIDTVKLAKKVDAAVGQAERPPLDVFVQVNTSGEESKSGVDPGAPVIELSKVIAEECPNLKLRGLMTIGMPDYTSRPENFECLKQARSALSSRPRPGGFLLPLAVAHHAPSITYPPPPRYHCSLSSARPGTARLADPRRRSAARM